MSLRSIFAAQNGPFEIDYLISNTNKQIHGFLVTNGYKAEDTDLNSNHFEFVPENENVVIYGSGPFKQDLIDFFTGHEVSAVERKTSTADLLATRIGDPKKLESITVKKTDLEKLSYEDAHRFLFALNKKIKQIQTNLADQKKIRNELLNHESVSQLKAAGIHVFATDKYYFHRISPLVTVTFATNEHHKLLGKALEDENNGLQTYGYSYAGNDKHPKNCRYDVGIDSETLQKLETILEKLNETLTIENVSQNRMRC